MLLGQAIKSRRASKLQLHLGLDEIGRVRVWSRCAGRPKPLATIERQSRVIAGCDPYQEPSRPVLPRPFVDLLDQGGANALPAQRALDEDADHGRVLPMRLSGTRPVAMPSRRPSCSATTVTTWSPAAPFAARSCQRESG